jgi:hypothetical protein
LKKYVPGGRTTPPGISMGSLNLTIVFLSPFCAFEIGAITDAIRITQNAAITNLNRLVMLLLLELRGTNFRCLESFRSAFQVSTRTLLSSFAGWGG